MAAVWSLRESCAEAVPGAASAEESSTSQVIAHGFRPIVKSSTQFICQFDHETYTRFYRQPLRHSATLPQEGDRCATLRQSAGMPRPVANSGLCIIGPSDAFRVRDRRRVDMVMGGSNRTCTQDLPGRGDAFLMPLPDGRLGICRVIRRSTAEEQKRQGLPHVLVTASSWIGSEAPNIEEPSLREVLILTHYAHKGLPEYIWVSDPLPESYVLLGCIEPTNPEEEMECLASSGWEWLPYQVYQQWRWDHEREQVRIEETERKDAEDLLRAQARPHEFAAVTLEKLRRKRRFGSWKGFVAVEITASCRQVFRETIESLIALGPEPEKRSALKILHRCIHRLNELDLQRHHFITTIEREDLCDEFDAIAYAAGFHGAEGLADRWREW